MWPVQFKLASLMAWAHPLVRSDEERHRGRETRVRIDVDVEVERVACDVLSLQKQTTDTADGQLSRAFAT